MGPDDAAQPETEAQWLEHSVAWRFAHLELAPSDQFRRMAIQQHERSLPAMTAPSIPTSQGFPRRFPKRSRRS